MAVFELGFGDASQTIEINDAHVAAVLRGNPTPALGDIPLAVAESFRNPIASAPLAEIVRPGEKICLIVSDITRSWIGYEQFLPSILNELNKLGIPDNDILLLVALGAHRRHAQEEHVTAYGAETVGRVRIEQSIAQNEADFEFVGETTLGTRAYLNKHALAADKVILTGGIAYHSMAGFGGGRKSVVPGIARYSTIQENHRHCLHPQPGGGISEHAYCGSLSSNLMHKDLVEMTNMLRPAFLINAIHTPDGELAAFFAGEWDQAWHAGRQAITEIYGVPFCEKADIVIASAGGAPKDMNLYQGTKTMDNAVVAVKSTGVVILTLACPDIGEPPDFSNWFTNGVEWREGKLRENFTVPGFVALKCGYDLKRIPHILVTLPRNREFAEKAGFIYAADLARAFSLAKQLVNKPDYRVVVMPDAANIVPLYATI